MTEQTDSSRTQADKARRERKVKIGFLAVVLIAAALIYLLKQRADPPEIDSQWPPLTDSVLAQAKSEGRPIVVFFVGDPVGDTTKRMLKTTLKQPGNRKALAEGRFIQASIKLELTLKSDKAVQYGIKKLPTMMVLRPDGKERIRKEGFIGEVDFREEFLKGGLAEKK